MSKLNPVRSDASDVDDLLREFFQREMPAPWPACPRPAPARQRRLVSLWSYRLPRVALAASVALLFAGYLTVARWFPQDGGGSTLSPGASDIADFKGLRSRPAPGPVDRGVTPGGVEVEIMDEATNEGRVITIQPVAPPKGSR